MRRIKLPLTKVSSTAIVLIVTALSAATVAILDAISRMYTCPPA